MSHGTGHAQASVRPLVLPASAADNARYSSAVRRPEPGVTRQRPIALDLGALVESTPELRIDLFDGRSVVVDTSAIERRGADNYTWHGKLPGRANAYALLTVVGGRISGAIELGDAGAGTPSRYQIQSTSDGLTLLREIDAASFPQDHPGGGVPLAPGAASKSVADAAAGSVTISGGGAVLNADAASTIDVMVVYSNQTAAAAGVAIDAQIQQAIDTANLVYANSGIATRLRLVHTAHLAYDESGDFATDLNRLTGTTDGYMDDVHALRDQYGADLVSLFVENGQYCGYGWVGPSAGYAFSVVNRGCASGNYSFPHELGHNFGARHDVYVDATTTPYAFGHGWVDVAQRWRDVMAYDNACAAVGVSCVRVAYMSNPNLTYGSPPDPLGSAATADVVRVHNQNAATVANFRAAAGSAPPPAPCAYALSPASASVPASGATGSTALSTAAGCAWSASSSATWLTITTPASGTGSASVGYAAGANGGASRSANLSIGGQTFLVTQAAALAPPAAPAASVSPGAIDFGAVSVGRSSGAKTATLTNAGGGTLTIASLTMSGANPLDFTRSGTCAVNANLAAGQSCTVTMTFKPGGAGARAATLTVGTSAGAGTVQLTGTGKKTGRK